MIPEQTQAYQQILASKMRVLNLLLYTYEKNPTASQRELLLNHLTWQKDRVAWMTANAHDQVQIETEYCNEVEKQFKDIGLFGNAVQPEWTKT